jgi:hypothetical protein
MLTSTVIVVLLTVVIVMMISRKSLSYLINNKSLNKIKLSSSLLFSSTTATLDDIILEKDGPIQADTVKVDSQFLKTLFERGY